MHLPLILACSLTGGALGYILSDRTAHTGRMLLPAGWRPALGALTALLCSLVAWQIGPSWELPAFLLLPVFGVLLAAIDLHTKLLPNALILPFLSGAIVLLSAAAAFHADWDAMLGAVIGSVSMFALYLALALISPTGLGMGDVKLAAVLGLYTGYLGPANWLVAALGGFLLGGIIAIALLTSAKASHQTTFPFGPAMLAAGTLALFV